MEKYGGAENLLGKTANISDSWGPNQGSYFQRLSQMILKQAVSEPNLRDTAEQLDQTNEFRILESSGFSL